MENRLIKYLKQFRSISKDDQVIISEAFNTRYFKAGEQVAQPGNITKHLYFINTGILKIIFTGEDEKEITYFFLEPGQMISFLYSLYREIPAEQGLRAAVDVELLMIEKNELESLFSKINYFKALLDEIAHSSMANMINLKNNYLLGDSLKRYRLFLQLQPLIALYVAQTDIASYLGITPQSLSRIRKKI